MGLYQRNDRVIHFIHIPKTGGMSVKALLQDNGWIDITPSIQSYLRGQIKNNHGGAKSDHIHRRIWKEWNQNYEFQFTIIRNPYSRLESHLNQVSHSLDLTNIQLLHHVQQFFDEIIDSGTVVTPDGNLTGGTGFADNHWRPQVDFIGPDTSVYRLENIDELVSDLKKREIISDSCQLNHLRKGIKKFSGDLPWGNFLRTHQNFIEFYNLDFRLFEYKILDSDDLEKSKI
tara:strand:- start:14893 stop:15582 length:690 start_codon:yes stop_codon:yes gene_type:complete